MLVSFVSFKLTVNHCDHEKSYENEKKRKNF